LSMFIFNIIFSIGITKDSYDKNSIKR